MRELHVDFILFCHMHWSQSELLRPLPASLGASQGDAMNVRPPQSRLLAAQEGT